MEPPKDLYVEIRVINDCGEIITQDGIVNLEKNTIHFLRKADVKYFSFFFKINLRLKV